jgi:hypothetical protein
VSAFVLVLCYCRLLYLEFALSQAMGTFLRCMDRALRFVGGTTTVDIFDGMKTVVQARKGSLVSFNPRMLSYAAAKGFGVVACNPGKGNEKGRVERPIGFVRSRFWPGRHFKDLLDLNTQAATWRDDFANNRVHEIPGKVPSLVYQHEEKRLLKPLPESPFDTDDLLSTGVDKTFRVDFDRNRYSVPWRLVGQTVMVRANDEVLAVWLGLKQVAAHRRSWEAGQDFKDPSHERALLEHKPRAQAGALPAGLSGLGETGGRYFKLLAAGSRSLHKEIVRLTLLCELFGETQTSAAMAEVMQSGHTGAEYVEYVLRHKKGLVPSATPLRLGHPALDSISFSEPDLSFYDQKPRKTLDPDK